MKLASIDHAAATVTHAGAVEAASVSPPAEVMVRLQDVSKVHEKHGRAVEIFHRTNLTLNRGDFVAIMGPSGSGKTTLLNLMGGLDRPNSGTVEVHGVAIDRLSRSQLAAWRASQVGFIFQFYNLLPVLSAQRNVELPLSLIGVKKSERQRRAQAALQLVGLGDRASHYPNELSGGEQQRVAIARAIVGGPALLLCDEPTGDLDRETGLEVMELLSMLNQEYGKTIVVVTHDPHVATYANRQIRLEKGEILQSSAVNELADSAEYSSHA